MARGQAERLLPLLNETLAQHGAVWADLDAIAVGVGPGNFTGIRISVATARGLGLGLGIPVFGISSFEMAHNDNCARDLVSIAAPRDHCYLQVLENGCALDAPVMRAARNDPSGLSFAPDDVQSDLHAGVSSVIGAYAPALADALAKRWNIDCETADMPPEFQVHNAARIAAKRLIRGEQPVPPAPVYVRPADAAPSSDPPPVILDA